MTKLKPPFVLPTLGDFQIQREEIICTFYFEIKIKLSDLKKYEVRVFKKIEIFKFEA